MLKRFIFKIAYKLLKEDQAVEYGSVFNDTFIPQIEIENTLRTLNLLANNKLHFRTREDLKIENNYIIFDETSVRRSGKMNK